MSSSRLEPALRDAWESFTSARAGWSRGGDLRQWGKLSSVMAKIAADSTDKRRRLWRMRVPALAAVMSGAAALWTFAVRDTIPEDQRDIADLLFVLAAMIGMNLSGLVARWHLDLRVARARRRIGEPPYLAHDGKTVSFQPGHAVTVDGIMVAAIDAERRLIRVIAPVFFGFDVVFPVDAAILGARLTEPKLVQQPAVAGMPVVTSDVHVASTFLIYARGVDEPICFTVQEEDVPAAEGWMSILAGWIREDVAWSSNLVPASTDAVR